MVDLRCDAMFFGKSFSNENHKLSTVNRTLTILGYLLLHTCVASVTRAVEQNPKNPFTDNVKVTFTKTHMIVESDGIPNHKTGEFPNADNPNRILPQHYRFMIPLKPRVADEMLSRRTSMETRGTAGRCRAR